MRTLRELPSGGRCHAAFLLASNARLKPAKDVAAWVEATASSSSYMAGALDLAGTANMLVGGGLVTHDGIITIRTDLERVSHIADRSSLLGIASLLMKRFPPAWLLTVVSSGEVLLELIPRKDLLRLEWLGSSLVPLILEVHRHFTAEVEDDLRKRLGTAGELAVMSALRREGFSPVHVALVSDAYGYDIEVTVAGSVRRLEVKTCVPSTAHRVIVSRNEFGKALLHGAEWMLVQVTFSTSVILNRVATASDILKIREVSAETLISSAPKQTATFDWLETADFRLCSEAWIVSKLAVSDGFVVRFDEVK